MAGGGGGGTGKAGQEVRGQGGAGWVVRGRLTLDQGDKGWLGEAVRKALVVGSGGVVPGRRCSKRCCQALSLEFEMKVGRC